MSISHDELMQASQAVDVSRELANGFLVNTRREVAWGADQEFDDREPGAKGTN